MPKGQTTLSLGANADLQKMEERLMQAINAMKDELKKEIDAVRSSIDVTRAELTAEIQGLDLKVQSDIEECKRELRAEIDQVRQDQERVEFHSRKYNLLFFGLKTKTGEEEKAVREMCKEKMAVELGEYAIVNAHGVGKKGGVIARFVRWSDRQKVLFGSNKLKGTGIGISTDLPDRLHAKRSQLLMKRKELKAAGKVVRVIERQRDVFLQVKQTEGGVWENVKDA